MKPYENKKLNEFPDVADIQEEGRKSSVGKISGKSGDTRPYSRSKNRKATRRTLKRSDKAKTNRNIKDEIP